MFRLGVPAALVGLAGLLAVGCKGSAARAAPDAGGHGGASSNDGGGADQSTGAGGSGAGGDFEAGRGGAGGLAAGSGTAGNGGSGTAGNGVAGNGGSGTGGNGIAGTGGTGIAGTGGVGSGGTGIAGTGGAGSGGIGIAGTGGTGLLSIAATLDGLRLDAPCGVVDVEVCTYGNLPDDGQPHTAMTSATIGGTAGTPYQVTLHIRGVTGETRVMGGVAGDPTTFFTGGTRYADGTNVAAFENWRLTTSAPSETYYLNVFNNETLRHICVLIDVVETIPINGGATVTLEMHDGNSHQIPNIGTPAFGIPVLTPDGVAGSMNAGQFIQLNVDAVSM